MSTGWRWTGCAGCSGRGPCERAGHAGAQAPRRRCARLRHSRSGVDEPAQSKTLWTRIRNALFYSFDGFAAALRNEDAFRQEMLLALVLIPIAIQAPVSAPCKAMMVAAVLLVLVPMMTGTQGTDRALLQSDGSMNDR